MTVITLGPVLGKLVVGLVPQAATIKIPINTAIRRTVVDRRLSCIVHSVAQLNGQQQGRSPGFVQDSFYAAPETVMTTFPRACPVSR